mgnify:FL=1
MKKSIRTQAMGAAFAFALTCAVPCSAWAVETPDGVTTLDEAQSWAEAYLDEGPSLLSADEGQTGWELLDLGGSSWDLQAVSADTSWYSSGASSYTITSGSQLAGLAELVNSGVTFEGKTVTLGGDIVFIHAELTPIGGEGGAFNGTFDGAGHTIRGYSITSTADTGERATNIALFGECGEKSLVKNVNVSGASITVHRSASSSQAVSNVAALVAISKGSVENCTVDATIDVAVDTPQTDTLKCVMSRIGGMAANVYGNVKNCEFSGSVKAITNTAGSDGTDGNGRSPGLVVAKNIGGVVAYLGDPAKEEVVGGKGHGEISNCVFSGSILSQSPCEAGTDRFGEAISAKTEGVGGIAGFSLGSIYDSVCKGSVVGDQATMTGGIAGALRGLSMGGAGDTTEIDYGSADDVLYVKRCTTEKSAQVTGLHAGGGIVGSAGSYTVVTECANAANVTVNRWNKPSGGGVVGQSHGTVSFSSNTGTVKTATGAGYYVAGVAGMLLQYAKADGTPTTPTPEIYGCYSAGKIDALPGNKSAGLVGQNEGNLHDCLVLKDTCPDGEIYHVVDSSSGTYSNCAYVSAADLRAASSVAVLNKQRNGAEWDNYFMISNGQNNGYPVLKSSAATSSTTKLTGVSATCKENATYSGGDAVPRLSVTMGGKTLVQDVDFYVVPQKGATNIGSGYRASIVGIGTYSGTQESVCAYGIDKGDLSTCNVSIKSSKFDYTKKNITASDITVTDAYGNKLPESWYTFSFKTCTYNGTDATYKGRTMVERYISPTKSVNMTQTAPEWSADGVVHYGYYPVTITATSSSPYTGATEGLFKITPASLMSDVDIEYMNWDGQNVAWNDKASAFENGAPVFNYTGEQIRPTISKVIYKGHTLTEGVDYQLVYGNPNSDTNTSNFTQYANVGSADTNEVGCVTVRFKGGGRPFDFDNFVNMYFIIHGENAPAPASIGNCTVVANDQAYTGKDITPVKVYAPDGTELKGENYNVKYENNKEIGTATFTVRGSRDYTGTYSGSFTIYDKADALGYDDVNPTDWYVKDGTLKFCKESGLIKGTSDTTFLPYGELTRAQLATILWRFADSKAAEASDPATTVNETGVGDVMSNVWYTGAVNWAFKNGIITGYKDGDGNVTGFGPDDPVTREQVCVILMNYAKTQNAADIAGQTDAGKLTSMPDGSQVSTWAQEGVAWALTRGVIGGVEHADGTKTIEPLRSIYRCEMGAIMRNCTSNNDIIVPPTMKMQIPSSEDAANTAGSAESILRTAESEGAATANGAEAAASAQTPASVSATESPATETTTKED